MSPSPRFAPGGSEDVINRAYLPSINYPPHGDYGSSSPPNEYTPYSKPTPQPTHHSVTSKPAPTSTPAVSPVKDTHHGASNHATGHSPGPASVHGVPTTGVPPPGAPPGAHGPPLALLSGPPYPPMYASLGGLPTTIPDVPVSAVFLFLFFVAGVAHMKIFRSNKAKSHKFIFSGAIFAFCMIRVISTSLRIGWAKDQQNVKLGIAAMIFTAAGIVILYITNLFFTQRLLYARHPGAAFKILVLRPGVITTILSIIMVIIATVQSFYTLNPNTHRIDRDIQLYALTFFTVIAFVPLLTVVTMALVPRAAGHVTKVPSGKFGTNALIVAIASTLLTLGAGWKCGTAWRDPVPLGIPSPWYFSKGCFYFFNFTIEFLVVLIYLIARVDRRFYVHVPTTAERLLESQANFAKAAAPTLAQPTGFSSPHGSSYTTASESTTFEEKLPLFLQLVLDIDPDTGRYKVGDNPILQELNRGRSKTDEKSKGL